jgi:hypothetical protein
MICSICQLPGNKCGSSYEDQDKTFLLITMASGKKYRAEVGAAFAKHLIALIHE